MQKLMEWYNSLTEVTIKEGSNYTLTPTITPEDATNKLVIWTSEDENIATVEDGIITEIF